MTISPTRSRILFTLLTTIAIGVALGSTVSTQRRPLRRSVLVNGHEAVGGEVIVKLRPATPTDREELEQQVDADDSQELGNDLGFRRIHSRSRNVEDLVAILRTHPHVVYVEPNYVIHTTATPSDPKFGDLWGMQNTGQTVNGVPGGIPGDDIHAAAAWNVSTGSRSTVVGTIDTGIDYNHEDLSANVWSAPAAFAVNLGAVTITCPAGSHGFNAILRTCDPMDDNDHGSHVAGTIGAAGNNGVGVAGVNWTASIMASKFLDATGSGTLAAAIDAIEFTIQAKAAFAATGGANVRVLNNSWGGGGYSQALLDEINRAGANGILFVAAAGNNSLNNDMWAQFPADYTYYGATNIIAVAATDNSDHRASFSNYGPTLVHLGAPGVNVLSTTRGNTYQYFNGTSMAAPHVSGAAALILSKCTLTTTALKSTILGNVDVVAGLTGSVATNGRLNVDKALRSCAPVSAPGAPTGLLAAAGNARVTLTWNAAAGAVSYSVLRSTTPGSGYVPVSTPSTPGYVDNSVSNGTTYYYVVTATNSAGTSGNSNEASATPVAPPPPPAPGGLAATPGNAQVKLTWGGVTGAASYKVYRRLSGGSYGSPLTTVTTTTYTNTSLTNGTTYFYVVSAVKDGVEGPRSSEAQATPFGPPPAPTGLTATTGTSTGQIFLTWNGSATATSYTVKRKTSSFGTFSTVASGVTGTTFTNGGLVSGHRYYYVVSASNASGQSGNSSQTSATAK
jgi:subtilisin family serine protease